MKTSVLCMVLLLLVTVVVGQTVTVFNGASSLTLDVSSGQNNFSILLPAGTISSASVRLNGLDVNKNSIVPADIVLVTDTSGSMDDNCRCADGTISNLGYCASYNSPYSEDYPCKIQNAKEAALNFLDQLDMNVQRVGLVQYASPFRTQLDQGLTSNRLLLDPIINNYVSDGYTNMAQGMQLAMAELLWEDLSTRKYMVLLTDGYVNCFEQSVDNWICGGNNIYRTNGEQAARDIAIKAADDNIVIFTIAFGSQEDCELIGSTVDCAFNWDLMQEIAQITGGKAFVAADPATLREIYIEIAATIQNQEFPQPTIDTRSPSIMTGIQMISDLNFAVEWSSMCDSRLASCQSLVQVLQSNLDVCGANPCPVEFQITSPTNGYVELSNLAVEYNVPAFCGDGIIQTPNDDGISEVCDDGNTIEGDGCSAICQMEVLFDLQDTTVSFDYNSFPEYQYDLSNMISSSLNLPCTPDQILYEVEPSHQFVVNQVRSTSDTTISPQDWFTPTNEQLLVTARCFDQSNITGTLKTTIIGNADVILVTDFSGSMKKAVNSWGQGTGIQDCETLYGFDDARKSHLARCLDEELVNTVLSYQNNKIWPVFLHANQVKSYAGIPTDAVSIVDYIYSTTAQGRDKTCLSCALGEANNIFSMKSASNRKKFVVLMTDGVPTHCGDGSCLSISELYGNLICNGYCDSNGQDGCGAEIVQGCNDNLCQLAEDNTLYAAGNLLEDFDVIIYNVGFGLVEECSRSQTLLGTIAQWTGGLARHSSDVTELRQIYEEIANQILDESYVTTVVEGAENVYVASAYLTIQYTAVSNTCGNGILEVNEVCDDGNINNDDQCSAICTTTYCQDGHVQSLNGRGTTETCDDGNAVLGDGCNAVCEEEYCGDGITQLGIGEQCDDGNNIDGDGCSLTCQNELVSTCGNGALDTDEQCDDANTQDGDGCSSVCQLENINLCGNLALDPGESCDDGCLQGIAGQCEPIDNADACSQFCQLTGVASCGNGVIELGEECDDGNSNMNDACTNFCVLNVCGDGILYQDIEECDDGNTNNADTCRNNCINRIDPVCGNGIPEAGEQCDDGNVIDSDDCISCIWAICGDREVHLGYEQCDDGNAINDDGCTNTCISTVPQECGNGIPEVGEECDDGNTVDFDYCIDNCKDAYCGDGFINIYEEECDPVVSPLCSATCELNIRAASYCGNGIIETGEQCDDRCNEGVPGFCELVDSGDGCSRYCQLENPHLCGNNIVDPGEQCDDGCNQGNPNTCEEIDNGDGCSQYCQYDDGNTNDVTCKSVFLTPHNTALILDIDDILDLNGNTLQEIINYNSDEVSLGYDGQFHIQPNGLQGEEVVQVRVGTNKGAITCPIHVFNLQTNCDIPTCTYPIEDYCIDRRVPVLIPNITRLKYDLIFNYNNVLPSDVVWEITTNPDTSKFDISPHSNLDGFVFSNASGTQHLDAQNIVINFKSPRYTDAPRMCVETIFYNYKIGALPFDPYSDLLITGSRSITGYLQDDYGQIRPYGPYVFTAKLWIR